MTDGNGFKFHDDAAATVKRRGGIEHQALHHLLRRSADDEVERQLLAIDMSLQYGRQAWTGFDQVGELVQAQCESFGGSMCQSDDKRFPVGIDDLVEIGDFRCDGLGQQCKLLALFGLVGHEIDVVVGQHVADER